MRRIGMVLAAAAAMWVLWCGCEQKSAPPAPGGSGSNEAGTEVRSRDAETDRQQPVDTGQQQPEASAPTPPSEVNRMSSVQQSPATAQSNPDRLLVALDVSHGGSPLGTITLELDRQKAPITVDNFLRYVDEGFYQGTVFHRVIPDFMIQGGGFVSATEQKFTGLHPPIRNEARNGLKNLRGTIAMARTGEPHSATSQFFINVKDNAFLDYPSRDGWGYCVFGKVVSGMDVVDKIKDVPTRANPGMPGEKSQPIDPPVITAARRVQ